MCYAAIAAVVVTAATQAYQYRQEKKQRDQAEDFRQQKLQQERVNALEALRITSEEIHVQQTRDSMEAARATLQVQREERAAIGTATVAAGEAGAFGNSFLAVLDDFEQQSAQFQSAVQRNLELQNRVAGLNLRSAGNARRNRDLNARTLPLPVPDWRGFALRGAGQLGGTTQGFSAFGNAFK